MLLRTHPLALYAPFTLLSCRLQRCFADVACALETRLRACNRIASHRVTSTGLNDHKLTERAVFPNLGGYIEVGAHKQSYSVDIGTSLAIGLNFNIVDA